MEELINPHFKTGRVLGRLSWPQAWWEGGFSLEMVMELSEVDRTLAEVLVSVELLPVEALISLCLENPPHNPTMKKEQVSSSTLHCPTLVLRQRTHPSPSAACEPHLAPGSFCLAAAPRGECYSLTGMGTHRITELLRFKKNFQIIKCNCQLNTSTMFTPRPCPHVPHPHVV